MFAQALIRCVVFSCFSISLLICAPPASAGDLASAVRQTELEHTKKWIDGKFSGDAGELPFSFSYGGQSSRDILHTWTRSAESESLDASRRQHRFSFTDPKTKLAVRGIAVEYHDYPVIEWTLYFRNDGDNNSPIIADINAVDLDLTRAGDAEFLLHHNKGTPASGTDYHPYETVLTSNSTLFLRTSSGRASNAALPYFNVAWPAPQRGAILAIGWPGQWKAEFHRDVGVGLEIRGGQETTRFSLRPGEEVRTPLIAVLQYEGDWLRGQNLWRRWMVDHNLPRPGGQLPGTQLLACSSHQYSEMLQANEENQKLFIDRYLEEGFPLAYWWMDAGWYRNDGTWQNTGTWEVDRKRFPNGLRAITDHGRSKGVKSIVWFEPERVTRPSWLYDNHPKWLLRAPPNPGGRYYDDAWRLLNLGNREALAWLTDHIDGLIKSEGIDLYRQDFNIGPLYFWLANDPPDRQGITEIKYIEGYLAYWDKLLERNPGLRIDSCSSGGRRNDLETLRRSVPLLRSDKLFEPRSQQCHTYGMSTWIPYYGTGTHIGKSLIGQEGSSAVDVYAFRSQMGPSVTACWDLRDKDLDYDTLRELSSQLQRASPNYLGDYYPLTPYARDDRLDVWMAWQWSRPETGEGVVHAFRRQESDDEVQNLPLHGLDREATYQIEDADRSDNRRLSGGQLMEEGLTVELKEPRSAALFFYKKTP